jgi:hypothetical protein
MVFFDGRPRKSLEEGWEFLNLEVLDQQVRN